MRSEESWILTNNVHNITSNNGLVVLSLLLLAESEQILDYRYQKSLLVFLVHCTGNTANCPAQLHSNKKKTQSLNFAFKNSRKKNLA